MVQKRQAVRAFSYQTSKGEIRIGVETEEGVFNFTHAWEIFKEIKARGRGPDFHFLQMMVEMDFFNGETFREVLSTLRQFRSLDDLRLDGKIRFEVPIARPQKILCIGRNFKAHAEEWGAQVPEEPIFFAKMPSALLPHEGTIVLPRGIGRVDHELELAVVIGKAGRDIKAEAAWEYVAGYCVANDVTARDLQRKDMEARRPWLRSKSFDTFCPLGPFLVPRDEVPDIVERRMELRVNGQVRQRSVVGHMVFPIPELISHISRHMTLAPGDIICTGTPEGTLPLRAGDVVEAEIEGIGLLRNPVAEGKA
ncbi:MAG: fumarylacetoacetate hydrolase family protein [candidate division KSB1 bacterium]|nr:fumarylacetoacetate hydrolase family protein [candidate division KSB1 bacterium]